MALSADNPPAATDAALSREMLSNGDALTVDVLVLLSGARRALESSGKLTCGTPTEALGNSRSLMREPKC